MTWISVKEKTPDEGQIVWVTDGYQVALGVFERGDIGVTPPHRLGVQEGRLIHYFVGHLHFTPTHFHPTPDFSQFNQK